MVSYIKVLKVSKYTFDCFVQIYDSGNQADVFRLIYPLTESTEDMAGVSKAIDGTISCTGHTHTVSDVNRAIGDVLLLITCHWR